jgi:hypothetical protein
MYGLKKLKYFVLLTLATFILLACGAKHNNLSGTSPKLPQPSVKIIAPPPVLPKETPGVCDFTQSAKDEEVVDPSLILVFENPWHRRSWLEKTSRLLRQKPVDWRKEGSFLEKLTEGEVINLWINADTFGFVAMEFGYFFLGTPANIGNFQNLSGDNFSLFNNPAVFSAGVEAIKTDGNFLTLLEYQHPWYMPAAGSFPIPDFVKAKTVDEIFIRIQEKLSHLKSRFQSDPNFSIENFCANVFDILPTNEFFYSGLPFNFINLIINTLDENLPTPSGLFALCQAKNKDYQKITNLLDKLIYNIPKIQALRKDLDQQNYVVKSLADIRMFDLSTLDLPATTRIFSSDLSFLIQNSSTNYNRRRANYVLNRFFCDDLTPIQTVDDGQPSSGMHGSSQSCHACHYKLDPMAGFFREHGFAFASFAQKDEIVFDDLARKPLSEYTQAWLNTGPNKANRTWNVGYIRSENDEAINSYGESLDDLFSIIKTSPEVRSCLVKRIFQFGIDDKQSLDGEFLAKTVDEFNLWTQCKSSSLALKKTMARVALSNTFRAQDRRTDQCYDFVGTENPNAPPCRVRYILEKNCLTCHNSHNASGGLDVSSWVPGNNMFNHTVNGKLLSREESFHRITTRLESADPAQRMPLSQHMNSTERQDLYLWAQKL